MAPWTAGLSIIRRTEVLALNEGKDMEAVRRHTVVLEVEGDTRTWELQASNARLKEPECLKSEVSRNWGTVMSENLEKLWSFRLFIAIAFAPAERAHATHGIHLLAQVAALA